MTVAVTFNRPDLASVRSTVLKTTASNVVSDLTTLESKDLSDLYMSTSVMKYSGLGNSKYILGVGEGFGINLSPDSGFGTTTEYAGYLGISCQENNTDEDLFRCYVNPTGSGFLESSNKIGGEKIQIPLSSIFATDFTIEAVARYSNQVGTKTFAVLASNGTVTRLCVVNGNGLAFNTELTLDYLGSSLFCNSTGVALVTPSSGSTLVNVLTSFTTLTKRTIVTTGFTHGKVINPMDSVIKYAGYKSDGLYELTLTGTNLTSVQKLAATDINGISVYLKLSGYGTVGYIYRRSTDGVCRNHLGKRVMPITGEINTDYSHNVVLFNSIEAVEEEEIPIISG